MSPVFTITNAVTSALTRIERARGFLQAARLSDDWLTGMQQRAPLAVPALMAELVSWLGADTGIHPVLVAAIAQFQLVHIHPFVDGNGRTARLLSTLCLYRSGYDFKRLFTISEYYDRNRTAYYRALQTVREQNLDLTGWLEYFTEGLATQLAEVQHKGELLIRQDVLSLKYGLSERQKAARRTGLAASGVRHPGFGGAPAGGPSPHLAARTERAARARRVGSLRGHPQSLVFPGEITMHGLLRQFRDRFCDRGCRETEARP